MSSQIHVCGHVVTSNVLSLVGSPPPPQINTPGSAAAELQLVSGQFDAGPETFNDVVSVFSQDEAAQWKRCHQ